VTTGRTRLLAAALCVAVGASSAPAGAQDAAAGQSAADVAAARELFREGSALATEGKWLEARERYERSLKLKRASITLYSLGVAQKNTGQLVEALESFRAFLSEPGALATKPYEAPSRAAIAELEKRVAHLRIAVEPAALEELGVMVDGQPVPVLLLDRPRLVNPGTHEVTARARGHREARASAELAEGASATVTLVLEPSPEAPPAPAPVPGSQAPPTSTRAPDTTAPPAGTPNRVLPLVLIGGGAALLTGGIVIGLVGVGEAADAPTRDGEEADGARAKSAVGDVMAAVGIATAAVGVIVLVTQGSTQNKSAARRPGGSGARPQVAPWLGLGTGGARLRF
jgi:hypothetical protein